MVLKHIENYGFEVEQLEISPMEGYGCINHESNAQFLLICLNESLEIPESNMILSRINHEEPLQIVYLIHIKNNINEVIQLVEDDENENKTFLIYDEEDEIEFFLKDLWNIIIVLNR